MVFVLCLMISAGELWLAWRSTAHQGPWKHQFATITKSHCSPTHPFPMYDPNKHGSAWSARWIWGSPPPLLCSFSCINSTSGEAERSVCQVLSPEKNKGKLNEAWTWEQAHLNFSRGCSKHIKGNISNVQNKWRDVKTPKDFPPTSFIELLP